MTSCSLPHGVTLEFPRSGVTVRPRKGDVRNRRRHYTHGNFELTFDEGGRVDALVSEWEPAIIKFDDTPSYRFVVPPDPVKFKYDLEETEKAELELVDARKVLTRGAITKQWDSVSLGGAVEYILGKRKDDFDVIENFKFVDEERMQEHRDKLIGAGGPVEFVENIDRAVTKKLADFVGDLIGAEADPGTFFFGFDFNGTSPLKALEVVTDEFGIEWWVDRHGTLWFGNDAGFGEIIGMVTDDDSIVLKRYSVTASSNITDTIHLEGPYSGVPKHELLPAAGAPENEELRVIAEATATDIDGSMLEFEAENSVKSPDKLERTAKKILIQEIMEDVEGSIQINGIASSDVESLARLRVGDKILVDDSIKNDCKHTGKVIAGGFIVQSVHHRFDTRRGWEITTEVSRVPNIDAIETKSVLYNPFVDKSYEKFEPFAHD